jgi:translation initiation factor 1
MQNEIIIDPTIDLINSVSTYNNKIHIKIKQRNGRHCNTLIEQLPTGTDLVLLLKKMKRMFHCNGSVQKTDNGSYIQLFGDQRVVSKKFLIDNLITDETNIIIHGY